MSVLGDVFEFHVAMGLTVGDFEHPALGVDERMRVALIEEEFEELIEALAAKDIVAVADALADIQYVVNGAAVSWGIDLDEVHSEVHRSNMTKLGGERRADGKLLKPPHYRPPNIARLISDPPCGWWWNEKAGK